jgi:hypothetical protein
VRAPARAVVGHVVEVRECLDQPGRIHVRQPERTDPGGVDDPAAERQSQHHRLGRRVPPAPRHLADLCGRPARLGDQRIDERRLAHARVSDQHAHPVGEALADERDKLGVVAGHDGRDAQRAVGRE